MTIDHSNLEAWRASQEKRMRMPPGSGGGHGGSVDLTDAKIAVAEARIDNKFAELRGDLAKFATKNTVWGAMGTALGIVLAVGAWAGNRFDAGMTIRAATDAGMVGQRNRDRAQDQKLDEILARLPKRDDNKGPK